MFPQPGVAAPTARVDIRRFPWIRRLAADYVFDFPHLAEFYAGNPAEPSAWRDAIARTQRHTRARNAVADLLDAQQRRRGAPPEALASTAQLRDGQTVAVVTGQQAGLFGGPLFTLLKALTAIRLADKARNDHNVPAVAIFWIDAEDHDWDEVKSCGVLDSELAFKLISLGTPPGAHEGSVSRVRLDDSVIAALNELQATLQPTEFTPDLIDTLRRKYRPGAGMADAFAGWLESVLGSRGLIVYDASDAASKPLVADVFAHEVEHAVTGRLAAQTGARLDAAGLHAQVAAHDDRLALFHIDDGREAIRLQGNDFVIGDRVCSKASLLQRVREAPSEFSPNVLLRPLVQDTLFPTVCYVAGPSELAYLGQLGAVYESFGIPRPLLYQRATATILDSNGMKFLARHDFPLELLHARDEAALNELLESQLPATIDTLLQEALRAVAERMDLLAREVPQIDPTLEGATRSTLTRMQDDLKKLHGKIIQAAKRKDETLRRQYTHAQAQAFPAGHPQERQIGFVYFLNKYGPALVHRLTEELPLEMGAHWVVTI